MRIESLSRFRTGKEADSIVEGLERGHLVGVLLEDNVAFEAELGCQLAALEGEVAFEETQEWTNGAGSVVVFGLR